MQVSGSYSVQQTEPDNIFVQSIINHDTILGRIETNKLIIQKLVGITIYSTPVLFLLLEVTFITYV